MHRVGHFGVALAVYAPVVVVVLALDRPGVALLGGVVMTSGAMIPDLDMRVPLVTHRGITHTVWFAALVGVLVGLAGAVLGLQRGPVLALQYGVFGAVVGTLTILAHVLADALTPMGVRPFAPIADTSYSLGITTAGNTITNYVLLALGLAATLLAFVAGTELAVGSVHWVPSSVGLFPW